MMMKEKIMMEQNRKPIIGVLGNTASSDAPFANKILKDCVNKAYTDAVEKNGGIPMILPATGDVENTQALLALCDGILLPGGEDVDPKYYGQPLHRLIGAIRPEIDAFYMICVEYGFAHNLPMLGICRGMQFLNIARGGTLYQDLSLRKEESNLHGQKYDRSYPVHKVLIEEGSGLAEILGTCEICTNTMHHQAVDRLGEGYVLTAQAEDGVVEAFETLDKQVIAVQWHPEELTKTVPEMNGLFVDLVKKAAARA